MTALRNRLKMSPALLAAITFGAASIGRPVAAVEVTGEDRHSQRHSLRKARRGKVSHPGSHHYARFQKRARSRRRRAV